MTANLTPDEWVAHLAPFDRWNERILLAALALFGLPESLLDLGSGTGAMVNLARKLGVDAWGVDQTLRDEEHLLQLDLTVPLELGRTFVWVTCLETIEHLPPAGGEVLLDSIAHHLAPGGLCLFSAAIPGQGGDGHENLRHAFEWRSLLDARGLTFRRDWTVRLAQVWGLVPSPLFWLAGNVQVFERGWVHD